jgi:hypothetical protein
MDVIGRLLIRTAMLAYSQIGPTEWQNLKNMSEHGAAARNLVDTFESGPIGLDRASSLAGKGHGDGLRFTFEYEGFLFAVHASAGSQNTEMRFHANLGSIPYTAEDPYARTQALAVLRSASRALGGRLQLTPRQRILLLEDIIIDEPFTPVLLMSSAATLLILAKPYLELLAGYVHPPVEA